MKLLESRRCEFGCCFAASPGYLVTCLQEQERTKQEEIDREESARLAQEAVLLAQKEEEDRVKRQREEEEREQQQKLEEEAQQREWEEEALERAAEAAEDAERLS